MGYQYIHSNRASSSAGSGIFVFVTASTQTVGPTRPPIQWILGASCLMVMQNRHEVDQSPHSSAIVEKVEIAQTEW